MDTNCCRPKACDKKDACNHYIIKPLCGGRLIAEDLSDICLPNYRLYIEGDFYKNFPNKNYYQKLLDFYDNECGGQDCQEREVYDDSKPFSSSRTDCKLGKQYTCGHPKHPDNAIIANSLKRLKAEDEAFQRAGIDEGTVTYTCPICGGEAVANRYKYNGRYHGLGSGCKRCGFSHS